MNHVLLGWQRAPSGHRSWPLATPQGTWAARSMFAKRWREGEREGSGKSPVDEMPPASRFFAVYSLHVKVGPTAAFPRPPSL